MLCRCPCVDYSRMLIQNPCCFNLRIRSQKKAMQKSLNLNRTRLNQLFIRELASLPYIPVTVPEALLRSLRLLSGESLIC